MGAGALVTMGWGEEEAQRRIERAVRGGETTLWLEALRLTRLPSSARRIKGLRRLYLQDNRLEQLPDWLAGCASLEVLNVNRNALLELPDWIGGLSALRALRLHGNLLTELPNSLRRLTGLDMLGISSTDVAELPSWIGELRGLVALYIGGLQLGEVPEWIRLLPRLSSLDLTDDWLNDLPVWIGELPSLRRLLVASNSFDHLPLPLRGLRGLAGLDLEDNRITALPDWIGELTFLRYLDLKGNGFGVLPESFGRLTALRTLELDSNPLIEVPEPAALRHLTELGLSSTAVGSGDSLARLGRIRAMRRLRLRRCALDAVPDSIRALDNLTHLDLALNELGSIPGWLAELTHLRELDLSSNGLTELPPSVTGLRQLTRLEISGNALAQLPVEVCGLSRLRTLGAISCGLTGLPEGFERLTRLRELILNNNQLAELPDPVARLGRLERLRISSNHLTEVTPALKGHPRLRDLGIDGNPIAGPLPDWIGRLPHLERLHIGSDSLCALPGWIRDLDRLEQLSITSPELRELPDWLGELTRLTYLSLGRSPVTSLPESLAALRRLDVLILDGTGISELPTWIGSLSRLSFLSAGDNRLTQLPPELGSLRRLEHLYVPRNNLARLPEEIGGLKTLTLLKASENALTEIPRSLGELTRLVSLFLSQNQLSALPSPLKSLRALRTLRVHQNTIRALPDWLLDLPQLGELTTYGNPLTSPPPEIAASGGRSALDFLSECRNGSSLQWLSKLLVVGEGGVGKTSTIKNLIRQPFDPDEATTHGMRTFDYLVPHPEHAGVEMRLRTWDFGGQEIYHATHQFFLTDRSLFLLLWNARLGWEQGRLRYWLDIISARAPESPVLLVATNAPAGGRPVDLPLGDLRREYPQVVDNIVIDNKNGDGLGQLREQVATNAAGLPLMGAEWPTTWIDAAQSVERIKERHITRARLWQTMRESGLADERHQRIVAGAMHALGSILFHIDDRELGDTVVLQPEWVNTYISLVLDSPEVEGCQGLLSRGHLESLWADLDRGMRDHFLGMMDKYDLSYRTGGEHGQDVSLVVERLPWNAPAGYQEQWDDWGHPTPAAAISGPTPDIGVSSGHQIRVIYQLNTTPPGIPTWFIARSHRFTTNTHWRTGALLAHPDGLHRALIRSDKHRNEVELAVRGPAPAAFFALLDDGLNLTLERYPGLSIRCMVPCPCRPDCTELYDYRDLQSRLARTPPRTTIECRKSGEDVHVPLLLLGLPPSDRDEIRAALSKLSRDSAEIGSRLRELASDQQRMFLKLQQQFQNGLETRCPNVFAIAATRRSRATGSAYELHLYCEEPGAWHRLPEPEGVYGLRESPQWLKRMAPYLRTVITLLKHAAPLAGPLLGATAEHLDEHLHADIDAMAAFVDQLPDLATTQLAQNTSRALATQRNETVLEQASNEADFRALEALLTALDPERHWGGLSRVLTPEGLTLYLCPEHAAPYGSGGRTR